MFISGIALAEEKVVTNPPTPPAAEQAAPAPAAPTVEAAPAAPKIDTGDTAWMIVATALVMLMTLPGLALFYGGLAKRKDTSEHNGNVFCHILHCESTLDCVWFLTLFRN